MGPLRQRSAAFQRHAGACFAFGKLLAQSHELIGNPGLFRLKMRDSLRAVMTELGRGRIGSWRGGTSCRSGCGRRPVGVRLRLADVASGFRFRRAGAGAADRSASGAVRLFVRASRHARASRTGAGLDRGGVPRVAFRVAAAARAATVAYLRAREQVTGVYLEVIRRVELEDERRRQVRALCSSSTAPVQYAGRLTLASACSRRPGPAAPAPTATMSSKPSRALEALGYRETDLHLIAGGSVREQKSRQRNQERKLKFQDPDAPRLLSASCTRRAVASSSTRCSCVRNSRR